MSHQVICEDLPSTTFLQESEFGAMHLEKQDGQTTRASGQEVAHANLSARQAKEKGSMTSGTYGRHSSGLLKNAILASLLANRLQAQTASLGSTLYKLTWKVRTTPLQVPIFALRASVLRTSGSDCIGWPTPTTNINFQPETRRGIQNLSGCVRLAGWQTPLANDATGSTHCYSGKDKSGTPRICLKLPGTVKLCTHYRLTASGEMQTGFTVEMKNIVQLDPAHSRWLMALPKAWDEASPHWEEWQSAIKISELLDMETQSMQK